MGLAQISRLKNILLISICKSKSKCESETSFHCTESKEASDEVHFLNVDNFKNNHFVLNIQNVLNFHASTLEVWKTIEFGIP